MADLTGHNVGGSSIEGRTAEAGERKPQRLTSNVMEVEPVGQELVALTG